MKTNIEKEDFLTLNKDLIDPIVLNTDLTPSSKTTYINSLIKVCKICSATLIDVLHAPNKFAPILLEKVTSKQTARTYISAIISVLKGQGQGHKVAYDAWYLVFTNVRAELKNKFLKQEPSQKQIDAHVQWEEIIKARDAIKDKLSLEYVLMCLVTMIPPRRQLDWFNIMVCTSKPDPCCNHINITHETPYVFLCVYKTWPTYGNYESPLPSSLVNVIKSVCDKGGFLFKKEFNSVEQFTSWSNRIIKKVLQNPAASMNTLRHSYASYMARTNPNMSLWMRAVLARDMGHSLEESLAYDIVRNLNTNTNTGTSVVTTLDGSEVNHLKATIKQLQKRIKDLEKQLGEK